MWQHYFPTSHYCSWHIPGSIVRGLHSQCVPTPVYEMIQDSLGKLIIACDDLDKIADIHYCPLCGYNLSADIRFILDFCR